MCGIAGFFGVTAGADERRAVLGRMCDAMRHRGPDDEGYYDSPHVGLGMRRLSIIDLQGGHQPVSSDDGRIQLVFNGEISIFALSANRCAKKAQSSARRATPKSSCASMKPADPRRSTS